MVDHTGQVTGTKAIVDVHNAHAAGTGIEHGQKRRHAAKRSAVAHARRNRDDRAVGKAADDAGKCPFHARNRDNGLRAHHIVRVRQKPVEPRDTHVIEPHDLVSERFGRERRFLRDRLVAGAAGGNHDGPAPRGLRHRARNADFS